MRAMGATTDCDNKPSVEDGRDQEGDYGPFPWWSQQILRHELRKGKTRADLAREWDTTWGTIDNAVQRHGLESEAA